LSIMLHNATDTLRIDTAMLNAWRSEPDYDYASEVVQSDFSIGDWISRNIWEALDILFRSPASFYHDHYQLIWSVVGGLCVAAIAYFVYRKHPALFGGSGTTVRAYDVVEDTIYGVDFPAEIAAARQRKDWREAVRLVYLYALKKLADSGRIDWQPWKTPAQYAAEVGTADFRLFSNHFLRVRYGNFAATEELAGEMQRLFRSIVAEKDDAAEGGTP